MDKEVNVFHDGEMLWKYRVTKATQKILKKVFVTQNTLAPKNPQDSTHLMGGEVKKRNQHWKNKALEGFNKLFSITILKDNGVQSLFRIHGLAAGSKML